MTDLLLKWLIQAAIETFPIDEEKKQILLKMIVKNEKED